MKLWKSIEVPDIGNVRERIDGALNALSREGYEPAFITYIGDRQGTATTIVMVSGWKIDTRGHDG